MCWLVVLASDNTHIDPEKDKKCSKKGDIVSIHEQCTEPPAARSKFVLIEIPDLSVEEARLYLSRWSEERPIHPRDPFPIPETDKVHRRLFKVDLNGLPRGFKSKLKATKMASWDKGIKRFENYIINKRTGRTEREQKSPIITFKRHSLSRKWRTQNRD